MKINTERRKEGEREKKGIVPPVSGESPSTMGGNKSKFRIINNARGRIVRVARFPGVNQLLLFSPPPVHFLRETTNKSAA